MHVADRYTSFNQLTVNLIVFLSVLKVTDTFALKLEPTCESSKDADEVLLKHLLSISGPAVALLSLMASITAIFGQHGSKVSEKLVFKVSSLPRLDLFVLVKEHNT